MYIESSIAKGSKCVVDAPGVLHLLHRVGDPCTAQARPDIVFEMVSCVHQRVFNEIVRHAVLPATTFRAVNDEFNQLGFLRVSAKPKTLQNKAFSEWYCLSIDLVYKSVVLVARSHRRLSGRGSP